MGWYSSVSLSFIVYFFLRGFRRPIDKQTGVGEAMQSSRKQNKNMKRLDVPEVTSFVTNLLLHGQLH